MSEEVAQLRRELAMMRSQTSRLESVSRQVWQYQPAYAPSATYFLTCGGGNTLDTITTSSGTQPYYGLKRPASAVTTVPTVVPSTTSGATPDGVTPAYIISESGTQTLVWAGVRLKPAATEINEYSGILAVNTCFITKTVVMMPLATDPTVLVPVYSVFRV